MSADDEKLWPRMFGINGDKTYLELMKELSDQEVEARAMSEQQAPYNASESKPIPGIVEGRMVHYVIPDDQRNGGQHRAATLCRVWDHTTGLCNLHVFWDGNNDNADDRGPWLGSIYYSAEPKPNTWHWMERA